MGSKHIKLIKTLNNHSLKEQEALDLINKGKLRKAEIIYRQLIAEGNNNHFVYGNLGAICGIEGKKKEMIELLKTAIQIKPDYLEALNNLGVANKDQNDLDKAIAYFQQALKLKPNYPEALNNLGNCFKAQGKLDEALSYYQQALKIKSNYPDALNNLGLTLREKGKLDEAISCFEQALKLQANYPEALSNLGICFRGQGHLEQAISCFQQALKLKPKDPEICIELSFSQLLDGDYSAGWENYDWRWKLKSTPQLHDHPTTEQWQGESLNKGESLIIVSEQGLGDTIQFMRYIPYLRNQNLNISFYAQTKLHSLIRASGIDHNPLEPSLVNTVSEGKWIPLLSIPKLLKVRPNKPIVSRPYISIPNEIIKKWESILRHEKKPIVGINWQGNKNAEKGDLKGRSIPLELFSEIKINKDFKFLSLQKGFGSDQINNCSFKKKFVNCQDTINATWDFLETAAIIINCDLVITTDTSIAHLAGGLGAKTWVLLSFIPEWRWGMYGDKTFWYRSIQLFRQKEKDNWKPVFEKISNALNQKI